MREGGVRYGGRREGGVGWREVWRKKGGRYGGSSLKAGGGPLRFFFAWIHHLRRQSKSGLLVLPTTTPTKYQA